MGFYSESMVSQLWKRAPLRRIEFRNGSGVEHDGKENEFREGNLRHRRRRRRFLPAA